MSPGPLVILILKLAVITVTGLFLGSLVALARGNLRLHGRLNLAFFTLTLAAVLGFETLIRLWPHVSADGRELFDYFDDATRTALTIHLCFSVPATLVLPIMLFSGLKHRRWAHVALGVLFVLLWTGTFVTGVFCLPHTEPQVAVQR